MEELFRIAAGICDGGDCGGGGDGDGGGDGGDSDYVDNGDGSHHDIILLWNSSSGQV